jgi:hypothetical protein
MRHSGVTFLNRSMSAFIGFFLSFSPLSCDSDCGSGRGEEPSGERILRLIQIRLATPSLPEISLGRQDNSLPTRIADSNSTNAVNFSSACATKRFPSPRCASTIQIVRPLESIAETQPQLQPALLRLSAGREWGPPVCARRLY